MPSLEYLGLRTCQTLKEHYILEPSHKRATIGSGFFAWLDDDEIQAAAYEYPHLLTIEFDPVDLYKNRGSIRNYETGIITEVDSVNLDNMADYILKLIYE